MESLKTVNYIIFAAMSNKKKKTTSKKSGSKPQKTTSGGLKQEKTEPINWKAIARDERTWKIVGAVSLLASLFLFIAFISYFFTWNRDQDVVLKGSSILLDNTVHVNNLLGKLGALVSHFFIFKAFGIASLLICTFFFVVGINLLFNRKVFSIWRNLKYVTVGLLVLSVALAFVFHSSGFPVGGTVGTMISDKLESVFGKIGTAAVLLVVGFGYFIWQFNPAFNFPKKKEEVVDEEETGEEETVPVVAALEEQVKNKINEKGNK